jgi:hypothetical protein
VMRASSRCLARHAGDDAKRAHLRRRVCPVGRDWRLATLDSHHSVYVEVETASGTVVEETACETRRLRVGVAG